MKDNTEFTIKRAEELSRRSQEKNCWFYTDFLTMAEQAEVQKLIFKGASVRLWGGVEGAERKIARFGNADDIGYEEPWPISCILCRPVSEKFAQDLTHRDFLGALMNLGIERSVLGDIVIREKCAYIFASEKIAGFVCSELTKVKNTTVTCAVTEDVIEGDLYATEGKTVQVQSPRIDAVVAKMYDISREVSQKLFSEKRVFVNSQFCENNSRQLQEDDLVSVRGFGRFIYKGEVGRSKKGKLNIRVERFV